MLPPYPHVPVMSSKYWKGVNNIDDRATLLELVPWTEVWTRCWDSDAHLLCYYPIGFEGAYPRYNKAILPKLQAVGVELVTQMLVLDYDRPGHMPWTAGELRGWLSDFEVACRDPVAGSWSVLYTTKNGARIVYLLDEPIAVGESEGLHRWLCQHLRECGIMVDDIDASGLTSEGLLTPSRFPTSDWTRCFRLPMVTRDGDPTWEEEVFHYDEQPGKFLDVSLLGTFELGERSRKATVERIEEDKPDYSYAMSLLTEISPASGRPKQSQLVKEAKRRLQGRDCFGCLFGDEKLAEAGSRDSTMIRYVGEAATLLYSMTKEGERLCTIEGLYALFLDPVMQLDPDKDTADWTDVLWKHVTYCWAREEAEERQREAERAALAADTLTKLDTMAEGVKEWINDPLISEATTGEVREWLVGRLVVKDKSDHYVMRLDGRYDAMPVGKDALAAHVRHLGMDNVIQIYVPKSSGEGVRMATGQEILDQHAIVVSDVVNVPSVRSGCWLEQRSDQYVLMRPAYYRRTDLTPRRSREVEEWLRQLFPKGRFEEACNWIAWALRPEDGPICAISLKGDPGAGKKMFVNGLAECFSGQTMATSNDLVEDFQPGLKRSPILNVDEGWPRRIAGKHPADMFRELVGGGMRSVNQKYTPVQEVWNPVRVVFTANNVDVVSMLCTGRDMSPEDRAALSIRLLHYDIGDRAARFLRRKGGTTHTQGWIKPDDGKASRYVLARHFLWIMENMRLPAAQRFLVEGGGSSELLDEMRANSGVGPVVAEMLITMIETKRPFDGLVVQEGKAYALPAEVLKYWRQNIGSSSEKLTKRAIEQSFKALSLGQDRLLLDSRPFMGRRVWYILDLKLLHNIAMRDGWKCERLQALAEEAGDA